MGRRTIQNNRHVAVNVASRIDSLISAEVNENRRTLVRSVDMAVARYRRAVKGSSGALSESTMNPSSPNRTTTDASGRSRNSR